MAILACVVPVHAVVGIAASGDDGLDAKVHNMGNRYAMHVALDPEVNWHVFNPTTTFLVDVRVDLGYVSPVDPGSQQETA